MTLTNAQLHQIHETRRQFLVNCSKFNRQQLQDQMRFAREAVEDSGPLDDWAAGVLVKLVDTIGQFRFGRTWETDGK